MDGGSQDDAVRVYTGIRGRLRERSQSRLSQYRRWNDRKSLIAVITGAAVIGYPRALDTF